MTETDGMGQNNFRHSTTTEGEGGGYNGREGTMLQIEEMGQYFRNYTTAEGEGGGHNERVGTMTQT